MAIGLYWATALLCVFVAVLSLDIMGFLRSKNQFEVDGRTVVITGGSSGLGRALGKLLAQKGANVAIVARNKEKLAEALEYISSAAKNPSTQRFHSISADLVSPEENTRLIAEVTSWNDDQAPDVVWANAGSSHPSLFIDSSVSTLKAQMDVDYWAAAYLAHATLKSWLRPSPSPSPSPSPQPHPLPRHFLMTSSVLAFIGIAGYAPYSPAKAALRSLADTLRSEINLYNGARRRRSSTSTSTSSPPADVKIHCVFPGTITTPGFAEEQKIKHPVTKILEEGDPTQTADEVAAGAVRALEKGGYLVTTNLLGHAIRVSALGGGPRNNAVLDTLFSWVVGIAWLFVGPDMEGKVFEYGKKKGVKLPE